MASWRGRRAPPARRGVSGRQCRATPSLSSAPAIASWPAATRSGASRHSAAPSLNSGSWASKACASAQRRPPGSSRSQGSGDQPQRRTEQPMAIRVMILNGPNLNLLGVREPHIYGSTTLAAIEASCRDFAEFLDTSLEFHQTYHEGALVDFIQSARTKADALIMNPAAYSFTSIAMVD